MVECEYGNGNVLDYDRVCFNRYMVECECDILDSR